MHILRVWYVRAWTNEFSQGRLPFLLQNSLFSTHRPKWMYANFGFACLKTSSRPAALFQPVCVCESGWASERASVSSTCGPAPQTLSVCLMTLLGKALVCGKRCAHQNTNKLRVSFSGRLSVCLWPGGVHVQLIKWTSIRILFVLRK